MTDPTLRRVMASRGLCPRCHALNCVDSNECASCALDLSWIRQDGSREFRRALSAHRVVGGDQAWTVELRAEIAAVDGTFRIVTALSSATVWELPFGTRLVLQLDELGECLTVEVGDITTTVSMPCRDVDLSSGVRLSAGCFATPKITRKPSALGLDCADSLTRNIERLREFTVGRTGATLNVADPSFNQAEPHFVIAVAPVAAEGEQPRLWLADTGSESGTFVNQQPVWTTALQTNDLIQVGAFAWVIWIGDAEFSLIPVSRIDGVGVVLDGVSTRNLGPTNLEILAGEFVAICGPSGEGKSTLLKALAGLPNFRRGGRVQIRESDGTLWDTDANPNRFRELLGYVSQDSILHDSLTPRQALKSAAALRGRALDDSHVDWLLLRAELPLLARSNPIRTLSGGQNKRLRTAAALASQSRLLLLDEPDSGLDAERRRRLLKHLKTLCLQGCTVIVVSHGSEDLLADGFDRVLRVENQSISQSGRPLVARNATIDPTIAPAIHDSQRRSTRQCLRQALDQLRPLIHREFALWLAEPMRVASMLIVALIFAAALAIAVPPRDRHFLGFLSVISVLWMSSSLSLLSIVGERSVFDHERHLFLGVAPYVISKLVVHLALACFQTVMFLTALAWLRSLGTEATQTPVFVPQQSVACWLTLLVIAAIGVALGLCLSAVANRRKELATFLLPLLMIGQIVFSAPIAVGRPNDSLEVAYRQFSGPFRGFGGQQANGAQASDESVGTDNSPRGAVLLSSLTASRYGDIALRGINEESPRTDYETRIAADAVCHARLMLAVFFLLLSAATGAALVWQGRSAIRAAA